MTSNTPVEKRYGVEYSSFVLGTEDCAKAFTDQGTPIPLFRYEALIVPAVTGSYRFDPVRDLPKFLEMLEEQFLGNIKNPTCRLDRVGEMNPAANCHGWVFTGGHFAIRDDEIPLILGQHAYNTVHAPKNGDLAVYRVDGAIVHSGFVRITPLTEEILVESKWGPFGVFVHPIAAHPGDCTFFRTPRIRHMLNLSRCDQ